MNRLFIAMIIPELVIREIVRLRDSAYNKPVKSVWEEPGKLHLTLKFLGNTPADKELMAEKILQERTAVMTPVDCSLDRFGFFIREGRVSILWLGLKCGHNLNDLVYDLEDDLEKIGYPKERRNFKPHITLMRIKREEGDDFKAAFESARLPELEFQSTEIALMKSTLMPRGSKYETLKTYYLRNQEGA